MCVWCVCVCVCVCVCTGTVELLPVHMLVLTGGRWRLKHSVPIRSCACFRHFQFNIQIVLITVLVFFR